MTSISTDVDVRRLLQPRDAFPAALGVEHLHLAPLQERGQREDVAHVVVHDQDLAAGERRIGPVELLQHPPLASGRLAVTRCRKSAVSSSSRSGERASLMTTDSASRRSSVSSRW